MNVTRWNVANVHQVLPSSFGSQQCLCGEVLLTYRAATEHIIDVVLADLRAQVENAIAALQSYDDTLPQCAGYYTALSIAEDRMIELMDG